MAAYFFSQGWEGAKHGEPLLVDGLEHEWIIFSYIGTVIPTDELIFFRGVAQPPTRLQKPHGKTMKHLDDP